MDKGYNRKRNTLDLKWLFCYEKIYSKKEKYKFKPHGDMIFPLSDWQNCGERCPRLLDSLHSWCKGPVGEGAWHINRTEKLLGDKEQRARKRVKGEARAKPCKTLGFILRVMVLIPRERGVNESLDNLT